METKSRVHPAARPAADVGICAIYPILGLLQPVLAYSTSKDGILSRNSEQSVTP